MISLPPEARPAEPTSPSPTAAALTRRGFLKSAGAAAGLVIALQLPLMRKAYAGADVGEVPTGDFAPNAFIRIAPDNRVIFVIKHFEMGQGVTTGLATILAEELDADWSQIETEYAPANVKLYANTELGAQGTGGSTSMANSWMQMRRAGATGRAMLVAAAAQRWQVPAAKITVRSGVVHGPGGRHATFGELAEAAAQLPVPVDVTLKNPKDFVLVGKTSVRRLDSAAKSTGTETYTIDVKLPGLLTAVIAQPPAFGATLRHFDATAAKKVAGVTDVVEVAEGVAVVATGMWAALQGRRALKLDWNLDAAGPASSAALYDHYRALAAKGDGAPVQIDPQHKTAMASAASTLEASYEFPYLAHAAMEPMNCVAWLHDGMLETWGAHQFPTFDHANAAKAAGLTPDKVKLHTLMSGGSFGRRANNWSDFTVAAVNVAKAIGRPVPVRVQWTREDDMRAGLYRPLYVHQVKVGLDAKQRPAAWQHAVVGQSIMAPTAMAAALIKNGVDSTSVEGVWPTPYTLPAPEITLHSPSQAVRPLWWRSVGNTHTAYVMETMMDELAERAGADPVAFRLAHLQDQPRFAGVLKLAAEKAGWETPLPKGKARGIAVHYSFETYVAQVAEVSLTADGQPKVERVVVAVDCGTAINPDQIVAQMEGGVGFALAALFYGEIDIENGRPRQGNYNDYRVLRMNEMPRVEVHIMPSGEAPTGVGEPGVPPTAPAVANALARLTGQRIRRLPLSRTSFKTA
ncbi:xanthine dehydrogenase family protein molybdopterin-binding subunit [Solimonas marina]|uniref:Xanthine dehydrogenase family protein molybdopterin-binding subunit n=1 Tax=Solimonas marina TaxID=2714601 RepID=A0A970B4M9_9GAMM|nr:xanthine dehydrogenase family protein molybdopterin-binding subunit [Solimonas marina]NKF20720.1 xanthine dehydrogenase family protein molybdopterin-binding subunit [Solimonas marina]